MLKYRNTEHEISKQQTRFFQVKYRACSTIEKINQYIY